MAINDPAAAPKSNGAAVKSGTKPWKPVQMSSAVRQIGNREFCTCSRVSPITDPLPPTAIRELMTGIDLGAAPEKGSKKPLLNLGLGDPTVFGNLPPPPQALAAIVESLHSGRADGYPASVGYAEARQAVAEYFDEGPEGNFRPTAKDVVMTHGASGALEMVSRLLSFSPRHRPPLLALLALLARR